MDDDKYPSYLSRSFSSRGVAVPYSSSPPPLFVVGRYFWPSLLFRTIPVNVESVHASKVCDMVVTYWSIYFDFLSSFFFLFFCYRDHLRSYCKRWITTISQVSNNNQGPFDTVEIVCGLLPSMYRRIFARVNNDDVTFVYRVRILNLVRCVVCLLSATWFDRPKSRYAHARTYTITHTHACTYT